MANYSTLKAAVADVVKTNGAQAITGANLQTVLLSIINSLGGGGYIFKGVATPSTSPGTPDENVFYITGAGSFSNMGTQVNIPIGSIGIFCYNGAWTSYIVDVFNSAKVGIFDISLYNAAGDIPAQYSSLSAALNAVPVSKQSGGMTVRYIDSTSGEYLQYRLMAAEWSTNESDWQGVDTEIVTASDNFVTNRGINNYIKKILSLIFDNMHPTLQEGGVRKTNGDSIDSTTYKRTSFIPIEEGKDLLVFGFTSATIGGATALALYSSDNVNSFISAEQSDGIVYKTASELEAIGAKYFRCTIWAEWDESTWFIIHENIQKCINDNILYVPMDLDLSKSKNAYTNKTIGSAIKYTDSEYTMLYKNIIPVAKGCKYIVKVTNGETPASINTRDCVIVDDANIIRQSFEITTTANSDDYSSFVAAADGYLVLCVDINYVSIEIKGYKVASEVVQNIDTLKQIKNKQIYKNTLTLSSRGVYVDTEIIRFKAGHTYVVIMDSDMVTGRATMGITGQYAEREIHLIDGRDVLKFAIGNEDVIRSFYLYKSDDTTYSYSFTVEEWDENSILEMSDPDTIKIASHISSAADKYVSKYICSDTDARDVIQQAINELPSTGGRILLCDGEYIINEVSDSGNAEIGYIGLEITNPNTRHYIEICGVSKPIRVSSQETKLGATIILSSAAVENIDITTHITLIGALPTSDTLQRLARGINLTIKNVGINIPDNTKAIRCIDAEYCSALQIENVCIGISDGSTLSTSPNTECIGIRGLGGWNYGIYYILRCIKVLGMGIGFDLGGEHLLMEQCAVRYSDIPYRFYKYGDVSKMAHPMTMINCCEESCKKSIVFGSNSNKPAFSIIDYNIEWRPTEHPNWNRSQKATEETAGDIRGRINFVANLEDYANTSNIQFWETGSGTGMITKNDADLLIGTTTNRPAYPYLFQKYYDTTLGKIIIYNGTNWE